MEISTHGNIQTTIDILKNIWLEIDVPIGFTNTSSNMFQKSLHLACRSQSCETMSALQMEIGWCLSEKFLIHKWLEELQCQNNIAL